MQSPAPVVKKTKTDQHRVPFLQLSASALIVMEPTREDGLALKLDALA